MAHVALVEPQVEISIRGCRRVDQLDGALCNSGNHLDVRNGRLLQLLRERASCLFRVIGVPLAASM